MKFSHPTRDAALAELAANGFTPSPINPELLTKPSTLHDGRSTIAICEVVHHQVDAVWNQPDYHEIRFL